jgi:hypothetical protein
VEDMNSLFIKRYIAYTLGMKLIRTLLLKERGSDKNKSSVPSFRGVIEVKHSIPGRVRLHIPKLREEENIEAILQLKKVDGIERIEVNSYLGTALFVYKEEIVSPSLIVGLIVRVMGLEDQIESKPRSMVSKELKSLNESLNMAVYEKSKGLFDFNTALILALIVVGAKKTASSPNRPSGLNYIWWGYSLMRGI